MASILGIDPGSIKTGFGIIESNRGESTYISSGVIRLTSDDFALRLREIFFSILELIDKYCPDELAIEQIFMSKNASSALKLGHARGAAIVACVSKDIKVYEYSSREIKKAVVGTGAAEKSQVQHMVKVLLGLSANPAEDAADALGAAICHVHKTYRVL